MLQCGCSLKTLCGVKLATHKRTDILWFHLYEVLKVVEFIKNLEKMGHQLLNSYRFSAYVIESLEIVMTVAYHCECNWHHWIIHVKMQIYYMYFPWQKGKQKPDDHKCDFNLWTFSCTLLLYVCPYTSTTLYWFL